jgi:hypothetical protein
MWNVHVFEAVPGVSDLPNIMYVALSQVGFQFVLRRRRYAKAIGSKSSSRSFSFVNRDMGIPHLTTGHFFRVDENQEKMLFYDSDSAEPVHGSCTNPLHLTK